MRRCVRRVSHAKKGTKAMTDKTRKQYHRIAADGSVMTFMTVEYMLEEREIKQLEELLEQWRAYTAKDGTKPFEDWEIEDAFQSIMETGSKSTIQHHMKDSQYRFGMINVNQLCDREYTREPYTPYTPEGKK